jgi:hypothetical protein
MNSDRWLRDRKWGEHVFGYGVTGILQLVDLGCVTTFLRGSYGGFSGVLYTSVFQSSVVFNARHFFKI